MSEMDRRDQLIACAEAVAGLAHHRVIVPILATRVEHDLEVRRVLDTVVRRWSKLTPTLYCTPQAAVVSRRESITDHVVPCRVLIDRMIMKPNECRDLLETAIV